MPSKPDFRLNCKRCKRLSSFLRQVKKENPSYYCQPVPAFGDPAAKLLIVGLAPGMHGANATGRPFTGDASGELLYETLHKFGYASESQSVSADDGLKLSNCRITNAVKCLPPQNKPVAEETNSCNQYLAVELLNLPDNAVIVGLGSIAHNAVLKALDLPRKDFKFAHQSEFSIKTNTGSLTLLSSYHCSRYNTQTKRLTPDMFDSIFARTRVIIGND